MAEPAMTLPETEHADASGVAQAGDVVTLAEASETDHPAVSPARGLQAQLGNAFHQSRRLAVPQELATVLALFLACSLGMIALVNAF